MDLTARMRIEEGSYWADVLELPGCFAAGDTLDELFRSLQESVALYLDDAEGGQQPANAPGLVDWLLSCPVKGYFVQIDPGPDEVV